MTNNFDSHLKDACRLTSATWAAVVDCDKECWFVESSYRLSGARQAALERSLANGPAGTWIEAIKAKERIAPFQARGDDKLGVRQIHAYRVAGRPEILLVGADRQSSRDRQAWRLVASLLLSKDAAQATDNYVPTLQAEIAYDLPRALDRVLSAFVRVAQPQGAWLAIRRGDMLGIAAQRNAPRLGGAELPLESSRLFRRLHRTLADVSAQRGHADWEQLPHAVPKSTGFWMCLPLVMGERMIGAVALWGSQEFPPEKIKTLRKLAQQVSQPVEVIVTFNELAGHLRRLAMLNEFALAVSSAQNVDQIARRVFGFLARSFGTELISMYLPSTDGRLIREYRNRDGKFSTQVASLTGHPASALLRGRVHRLTEGAQEFRPIYPGARSSLVVPLKYRSEIVGVLLLESARPNAFGPYDENLMVVIASHLAGLIEYGRLREEAEARARNLGLIHEVVQHVIGATDKEAVAQKTADLLAQYFAYELAGVLLTDGANADSAIGLGGSRAALARQSLDASNFVESSNVAANVFRTGQSVLVNNLPDRNDHVRLDGWMPGSEMCVALKDGDRILGLIDVRSSQQNGFANSDLMAMESLAGVLATVVSSANHYERLQDTVLQLRASQVESKARLAAQQEAESRLVQAAKLVAVGEMAAGIAHELNNPLTTVTGFSELILDETPTDSPHRADLEMVLHEALRARGVVRRLLDFARQGERAKAKCDLNEILEDVLALSKHFIHTSGVQLETSLSSDLPWVSVDTNQMKQVFLNLIHNAVQAMPTGGHLSITTEARTKDSRQWAVVTVRDSGIGINRADLDRIFEPFFTTRGAHGGTGLGLSVTYGIVTDHSGTIEVESQPGEGSSFSVWLPY